MVTNKTTNHHLRRTIGPLFCQNSNAYWLYRDTDTSHKKNIFFSIFPAVVALSPSIFSFLSDQFYSPSPKIASHADSPIIRQKAPWQGIVYSKYQSRPALPFFFFFFFFFFFLFIHFFGIAQAGATAHWRTLVVTQQ
jgi:hypothetical protein